MAFGLEGSTSNSGDAFLGRIQFDARTGFFQTIDRIMGDDGEWTNNKGRPQPTTVFAFDAGSMEVGYVRYVPTPDFRMTPYTDAPAYPAQPVEMIKDAASGKEKRAYQPGFRVKVMSAKTFGDNEPRYFSGSSNALTSAVEDLWKRYKAAPEAREGKVPVVEVTECAAREIKSPQGKTTTYSPIFTIKQWIARPEGFGDRTVPAPVGAAPAATPAPVAPAPTFVPARVPAMAGAGGGKSSLDDDIPFAPEHR